MKCRSCGADALERNGETYVCAYCRSIYQRGEVEQTPPAPERVVVREIREIRHVRDSDRLGILAGFACWLLFPLAWIIWAVSLRTHPRRSKTALVIALVQTALLVTAMLSSLIGGDTDGTAGRGLPGSLRPGLSEISEMPR
ncbi:hypothetical protein GX411_10150 [Candidatus Fermentibacteria bacterium]|nr:hypothetical protein [Candidatus Fermentibacteria bacterium]